MRIISGLLKSYRFNPPKGFPSRPTTDFAKEGLFNILENEVDLQEIEILDLFAGTGNISFEFASREAGTVLAVDKNYRCVQFIKNFSQEHNLDRFLSVVKADVFIFLQKNTQSFDLIFADPPFDFTQYDELIALVLDKETLKKGGVFIVEHSKFIDFSKHSTFVKSRKYGHIVFSFFRNES